MCFEKSADAHHFIGELTPSGFIVTKVMAKHVQTYLDYVNKIKLTENGELLVEQRLTLESNGKVYGTSDIVMFGKREDGITLHIFDFKYGKWAVDVNGNTQLMIYALGAIDLLSQTKEIPTHVTAHICQPRASHKDGINRSTIYLTKDLVEFGKAVADAVNQSELPTPPLQDGEWCRFCPAELICPKLNSLGRAIQV
jgi:hypothetical protein